MLRYNNWTFLCQSFEQTISTANETSFIYCDPPYIGRHVDYYDSWNEEQEEKLKKCLLASGARFMMSTWDFNKYRQNPYINAIWGEYQKITKEHFYFVGAKEKNRNSMMEALLINYSSSKPVVSAKKEYAEQLSLAL
jgi:DNA adenine methylase